MPNGDHSKSGAYFVSICTRDRKCLFGEIVNQEMVLNDAGRMVKKWYPELENKVQDIRCICGVEQHGWTLLSGKLWQRNYYELNISNMHINRLRVRFPAARRESSFRRKPGTK